ncbi:unnamed protein product [Bursaphelenchus xylophilus]|uniref:(pine wood nematode) hypothetical protein n=1 Tax=Bursaphelenchus xylophilus TaxID=6326 RepID=A0A1I7SWG6_BURXY|nr:unnamed protein product [Bursaphelenchus xylophilus]CAG9099388.1 unnamed protein product [Bursaphelenchus xylophilus]
MSKVNLKVVKEIVSTLVEKVVDSENGKMEKEESNVVWHEEGQPYRDQVKVEVSNKHLLLTDNDVLPEVKLESEEVDVDALVAKELSQLSISRQKRARNCKLKKKIRETWDAKELIHKFEIPSTSRENPDQSGQFNVHILQCLQAITSISERIPESNDDLDDYRLSVAIYTISQLTDVNKELSWRVQALGDMLNRSLREVKMFRVALDRTSGELKDEIDLLRKTTINTLRRIIESDLARKEKMQLQWSEVKSFIHKKNKRITELSEQLSGVDVDIGFLLASHKERIEAACVAERNYFQAAERVEDLELELKEKSKLVDSKLCAKCSSSQDESDDQRRDREERELKRLEQRKQFEVTEKRKFEDAQRVGAALQKHVKAAFENLGPPKGPAPWHNETRRPEQPQTNQSSSQPMFKAGHVPQEMFDVMKMRLEEKEQEVATQERMNQILTKDVEKYQQAQEKTKNQLEALINKNDELQKMVEKLTKELEEAKKLAKPTPVTPKREKKDIPEITVSTTNGVKNQKKKNNDVKKKGNTPQKASVSPEPMYFRNADRKRLAPPPLTPPTLRPPHPPPYYREDMRQVSPNFDDGMNPNMHFSPGFRAPMGMGPPREAWNGPPRRGGPFPSLMPPARQEPPWTMGVRGPPNPSSWLTSRR